MSKQSKIRDGLMTKDEAKGFVEEVGQLMDRRNEVGSAIPPTLPSKKELKEMTRKELRNVIAMINGSYEELDREYADFTRENLVEVAQLYEQIHKKNRQDAERLVAIRKIAAQSQPDAIFFADTVKFLLDIIDQLKEKPTFNLDGVTTGRLSVGNPNGEELHKQYNRVQKAKEAAEEKARDEAEWVAAQKERNRAPGLFGRS